MNLAKYNTVRLEILNDTISANNAQVEVAKINRNILSLIRDLIPKEIESKRLLGTIPTKEIYQFENEEYLEKIIGEKNNLLKINWLEKGIKVSKSVCQVIMDDGDKGTGFIINDTFLMTNFHVIPNKERAKGAKIIFNYEEDIAGVLKKSMEYSLESETYIGDLKLDYAYIKIKDNPEFSIEKWGSLNSGDSSIINKNDNVLIIQHALGETKQIASDIIIGKNNNKIYYTTDTQKGSSGSPVFNTNWEVIALHHAGKNEIDLAKGNGYVIDIEGTLAAGNEGIPIEYILEDIRKQVK